MKKIIAALILMSLTTVFGADIDLKKSNLAWHGKKVTGKHDGKILFKSGTMKLKDGEILSGDFVVDMKTITVGDLKGEWATKFITHISSKDFFIVKKYPTSKLKIKSVKNGVATADLTIKNKTNEVKFKIDKKGNDFSGTLAFDRTKFDMIYGSGDFFKGLGDKTISNEVKVSFKLVAKKPVKKSVKK